MVTCPDNDLRGKKSELLRSWLGTVACACRASGLHGSGALMGRLLQQRHWKPSRQAAGHGDESLFCAARPSRSLQNGRAPFQPDHRHPWLTSQGRKLSISAQLRPFLLRVAERSLAERGGKHASRCATCFAATFVSQSIRPVIFQSLLEA